ncbi:MAG: [protein-PII] uridylyltransferase [Beijerinckiaceae bacterium]|nr:[protein-PII] uridylyltransferase [Beijerinckiaceae bacterium]
MTLLPSAPAAQTPPPARPRARLRTEPAHSAIIDRQKLDADIAALSVQHAGDAAAFRREAVERFRAALETGRATAQALLLENGRGLSCAGRLSHLEDELIRSIHHYVVAYVHPSPRPGPDDKLCIAAVGGYGRDTLAPGSDIDLLFLFPQKQSPWGASVVEAILYVLWDLRQKVGHSTRSIDECLRQAKDDMTVRTALLEARFLLGDKAIFETMRTRFETEIVHTTAAEFVAAKLAERDQRLTRSGNSRYLVEPNVKEGKGGLRDLNTLFWISKYVYRVRDASDLVEAGLFTAAEWRLFRRCEEFLWRVRCHLHFVTQRAEERLTFDVQRVIAERLGYNAHAGLSGVERFMKHYFLVAKDVGDLTAIVCAALEEREAKPRAMLDRFIGRLRRSRRPLPGSDFALEYGRITVASEDLFERDPVNLIRLYGLADEHGLPVHPDATRLVTQSLKRIDARLRANPEANRLFLQILTSRNAPEPVLRIMNESGVLGRFIPEFGRIVALMQFNMYHHYTVDEHLLRSVGVLSGIETGRLADDHPVSVEVLPSVGNRTALYVALFLHDVAKGRDEDHSIAGARVARDVCPRLGLSEAETETVAWLIEHHLVMSNTAQSRDLSDRQTIQTFAAVVQTLERLRMLLVLTVCDIRAVGPGVWNGWKGQLLRTLYWETEIVIAGGHSAIDRKSRVTQAQEELRKALPGWSDPEFDAYAARHYQAYWLKVDLAHKIKHAELLHLTEVEMRSLATEVATDAFRGVTELTVVAPDHPRLLSIIAGACAASGANIVDAQIFTTTDGLALDTISISRAFEFDEDETRRAARVADAIEKALRGQIRLSDIIASRVATSSVSAKTFHVVPELTIDNNLSQRYTVLEISGLDRPGLLFDLTAALSRLNLNIGSAHIVTFGEKAVDVFYVTDLTGAKIVSPARQATIRRQLLEIFDNPAKQVGKRKGEAAQA